MRILFLLGFIIAISGCKSQKTVRSISCAGYVTIQYDKVRHGDRNKPKADKKWKSFHVYFINKHHDSIQGFVNDKLYYEKFVKVGDSEDGLRENFQYNYKNDTATPVLKIVSKTDNTCFDIAIDKKYKLLYIFKLNGCWVIRYSNIYYIN